MADATKIEWADATFNPWWGCERVSPACAHCYADDQAKRYGFQLWGSGHEFRLLSEGNWAKPLRWARLAHEGKLPNGKENRDGHRPRVFCASMADVFEERPELDSLRARLFALIMATPELDWLVLTKRPEFTAETLSRRSFWELVGIEGGAHYPDAPYSFLFEHGDRPNLWLGVSIENSRFTWRADVLREIPAAVRFISAEPLLGSLFDSGSARTGARPPRRDGAFPVSGVCAGRAPLNLAGIDWVIAGGESGHRARPTKLNWVYELVAACRCAGIAPFVKQLGARPLQWSGARGIRGYIPYPVSEAKGGDWDEWPTDLRVREFPRSAG